ncbi:MAG: hypothetical protein H6R19_2241 [Proteobacteria bacterium]|nr:hypothetical protein [Pseudomonadota bacterium]
MKVFRFNAADGALVGFATHVAALADLGGGPDCVYFAEDGSPLRLEQGLDGGRFLRPWASCASCHLAQILPYVRVGEGSIDGETFSLLCARFGPGADFA